MFSAETYNLCACLDDRALPPDVVFGEFTNDDVFQIQLDWQPGGQPDFDIQLTAGKISDGTLSSADDVDLYMGRIGYTSPGEDVYLALEGLLINQQSLPGATLGDTFWIGASVRIEQMRHPHWCSVVAASTWVPPPSTAAAQWRPPRMPPAATRTPCRESGYGIVGSIQLRTYDMVVTGAAWYTTGDDERNPHRPPDVSPQANVPLQTNSHRFSVPIAEKSWVNPPLIGEWVLSTSWFGAPDLGQPQFQNLSGTYGFRRVIPKKQRAGEGYLQLGMGLGLIAASGAPHVVPNLSKTGEANGGWGKWVLELDGGFVYRFYSNPNFSFRGLAGYMVPERNDPAWAVGFMTQFEF